MTSLADELMNDLDDFNSGSEEGGEDQELEQQVGGSVASTSQPPIKQEEEDEEGLEGEGEDQGEITEEMMRVPEGGVKPAEELDQDQVNQMDFAKVGKVGKVAKLYNGKTLKDVLQVSFTKISCYFERKELIFMVSFV